jgi:hypothetical protein
MKYLVVEGGPRFVFVILDVCVDLASLSVNLLIELAKLFRSQLLFLRIAIIFKVLLGEFLETMSLAARPFD